MENKLKGLMNTPNTSRFRFVGLMLVSMAIVLSGCQTTTITRSNSNSTVGPGSSKILAEKKSKFVYNSDIYLDVAVPVFDPGIPEDQDKLEKEGIWPQLRRAEANRFALMTKKALEETSVFGSVSVVPDSAVTADLFVLGRIVESDSQTIKITVEVVDITGRSWVKKTLSHEVSPGFYRDKRNEGKDPYQPVFDKIAKLVYQQLKRKREKDKSKIKQVTDIRFARSFSPQTYSKYLTTNRRGYINVDGLPSTDDPMSRRIETLRIQDQLFIDRLQIQYEAFSAKSDDSYKIWQTETLPAVIAADKAESKALWGKILGAVAVVGGVVASKSNSSIGRQIATTGAILGGAYLISKGFGDSAEAKVHRATIDEMGESLDLEMDPQVMSLEEKTVELTGTAREQYLQWRAHLKKIYELEATPEIDLENSISEIN